MTRILVTGAQGLLGTTLVPHLQASGHEVWRLARKGGAEVHADLTNPDQVSRVFGEVAPDTIVNLAALTNVDECERNPQLAFATNVRIVENLAGAIKSSGAGCHLVQVSTDQVYDGLGPHKESDVSPSNFYGLSKYTGELAAANVPSTILRTNFFGPSLCPGRASLSDWLVQSLRQERRITVFEDVRFSPLSLQRLVELLELVIMQRKRGIFNLGSKDGMSKADFAFKLAEVLDLPAKYLKRGTSDKVLRSAHRPKDMRMDSTQFEVAFGVELTTLSEEIQSTKAAYSHESR